MKVKAVARTVGKRALYFFSGWVVLLGGTMVAKLASETLVEAEALNSIPTSLGFGTTSSGIYGIVIAVSLIWAIWFWYRVYTGR